uniref:LRRNT domain-containing protein n=1 Tax=Lates calcarifer TaxID=8187 RepID=A0A4W6FFL6_LATCA
MDLPLTLDVLLLLSSLNAVVWACPDGCHCQGTKVICSGLSDFPRSVPPSTTALYFSNCRIDSLKPEDLADFSNALGILLIKDTVLREVRPGTFNSIVNVGALGLTSTGLQDLPEALFQNLQKLESLNLRSNKLLLLDLRENLFTSISYVATGAFRGLEQLGEISLHTNQLTNLQAGTFQGLPSLVNISLEHNFISSLPLGFLQGVSHLGQIDLRNNSLFNLDILPLRDWLRQHPSKANQTLLVCEIPSTLNGDMIALLTNENLMALSSTEEPVLTSTEKRRKPHTPPTRRSTSSPAVKTTATSEHEEVTSSGGGEKETLTAVPEGIFQNLPNLREIGLHGNKIAELPPNLFPHKDRLLKITLDNNLLTGLPQDFFVGFPQLKTLTLQKNQLTMEPVSQGPSPSFRYQHKNKVQQCKFQMMIYTALLVVEITCTLVLAKFTLSLYRLLQCRERTYHRVKLTRFSYRREIILRSQRKAEIQGLERTTAL